MTPGPTLVLQCPNCPTQVSHMTTASGNTFGATFYTDGQRFAPMMPSPKYLVRCPGCRTVHRLKDLEEVDSYHWYVAELPGLRSVDEKKKARELNEAKQAKYEDLPRYELVQAKDYFEFASSHAKDKKEELYLRTLGWRAGNDSRRKGVDTLDFDMLEVDNLRRLLHLAEGNKDFPQILVAEIYRELGLFHEAEAVLNQMSQAADSISEFERESLPFYLSLVQKKVTAVQELVTSN